MVYSQATGLPTHAFAAENLLDAMRITIEHWGRPDPQGADSGGCNVYMAPREMAKYGRACRTESTPEAWSGT